VSYRVFFNAHAARSFRKLPRNVQVRCKPDIDALKDNPRPFGSEKLSGVEETYRIRVGDYRILYEVHDDVLLVLVVEVGHRREVYG